MRKKINSIFKISFFTIAILLGGNAMAQNVQDQNKAIFGQFAEEVFVNKDLSGLDKYLLEDYIQNNPLVEQGRAGFHTFFKNWFEGVPDFEYSLKKIVADEDSVWVYGTYSGTQTGDWLGIPATNEKYSIDAVDIFRIEQGKLAEHWDVIDVYTLFKQLGTL
jgi:steroid delta-isomerase-like uncharacterized protein